MRLLGGLALAAAALCAEAQTSARELADRIADLLAAGDIEAVAALSNQPERRREELGKYRALVGDAQFRAVFAQYRRQPILEEVAIGAHRLVIRDLVDRKGELAGQYFVERDGRLLIDDEPSETRARLRKVLQDYRTARASGRKD